MFLNVIADNGRGDHDRVERAVRDALGERVANYLVVLMDQFDGWHVRIKPPGRESWECLFSGDERNVPFVQRNIVDILPLLDGISTISKPLCDACILRGIFDSLMVPDATLFSPPMPDRASKVVEPAAYSCHNDGRSYHLARGYTPNREPFPMVYAPGCYQCGSGMFIESARSRDDITLRCARGHTHQTALPAE
jgi:hypothetical protein